MRAMVHSVGDTNFLDIVSGILQGDILALFLFIPNFMHIVLRIVTRSYYCLQRVNIISYLKSYNCVSE